MDSGDDVRDAEDRGDAVTVQDEYALTAAHLYYVQDRTMEAIARELGTSRSTVSRLLAQARATGIVDIRIRSPLALPAARGGDLAERFGMQPTSSPCPTTRARSSGSNAWRSPPPACSGSTSART